MMTTPLPGAQPPLGKIPAEIACAADYELLAQRFMAPPSYDYVAGGSGRDLTVAANLAAFARWDIYPRLLRDVSAGHTRINVAGQQFAHPVFLAPVAFQNLAHAAGELQSARAAHAVDSCLVSSTLSSCSLEDVARGAGPQRWFQLYFQLRRDDTQDLLARAVKAGYSAIVVTLDAPIQVPSNRALRAGFRMPADCVAANLRGYAPAETPPLAPQHSRIFQGIMGTAPTWDDLRWLIGQTSLPVLVKGVLHPDDAVALRAIGVAGVVVSNHGGRTLDGAPASLDVLPAIRAATGPGFPLLFDGGIRSGTDIFKALALGADAVLIGRLQMYALSVAGALGVAHMVKLLREELEVCMALAGCATVGEIGSGAVLRRQDAPC
ncbi:alpha-hydroxy acid oxidase [Massilia pseudoviolaceinigra]|uniref:alpha-hydroxy acid oxidase n=1 Tax=Massilia pseudoviolaceinigra TaxID=3057165 RepID=UPI002796BAF9|nr:alpha-hydroxy acid oxidase [Massilia sp. CCM 9206]MDQ1920060.1 alpha-hydroxy acid oxidase [Massilia sp. CCM 9206]